MRLFAPADDSQKPSRLARTVWTLGLLSLVLSIAGFVLIYLYPPTTHNRFAEEVGAMPLDDYGPDVLGLAFLMAFLTVVLWVVFKLFHRKSGKAGKGLAATGVLLGSISLLGSFVFFQSYAGHLGFCCRYPLPADEYAVMSLFEILHAQNGYSATIGQGSYAPSLKELQNEGLFIGTLGTTGHRFLIAAGPTDEQGKITTFSVVARPVEHGVTGWANLHLDESGVVRYTVEDRPAWIKDPPLSSLP